MKRKTAYTLLLCISIVGFWVFENFYTPNTYSGNKQEVFKADISENLMPTSTTGAIIHHNYFTLSYAERYEQAEWVGYKINKEHLTSDDQKRPYFIEDPKVKTKSADWKNYRGSGYDRGHLCPAGDRRFSKQAYDETFYTSNISPQNRRFNAGIWNRLEMKIRYWTKKYGSLIVFTGGVLNESLSTIGEEDVAVPEYFFKIISYGDKKNRKALGFLLPNKESSDDLDSFLVPIDRIEVLTGIDFFAKLPEDQQIKLEKGVDISGWAF